MAIVREIKYFDYMENENKLGNAGHLKVDWWENIGGRAEGALQLRVNHLPLEYLPTGLSGEEAAEIQLQTAMGQVILGHMHIDKGMGTFDCSLQLLQELLGEEVAYKDIWSICIPLGSNRQVFCRIHEPRTVEKAEDFSEENNEELEIVGDENGKVEDDANEESGGEADAGNVLGENSGTVAAECAECKKDGVKKERSPKAPALASVPGSEDKWGHLCSIYPKITPFSDSREYLQIGPNDFVLLNTKYYSLIHNSFLLHGYYQYGQLVLCRVIRRGKALYYLGTPGIYLEREKQVALMYGFQSFECDSEPAMEGDFGYYMIQVEL